MLLTRYDPFGDLRSLWRESVNAYEPPATGFAPALDIVDRDGEVGVNIALPGVKPEDVTVEAHNGVLTIKGERKDESTAEGDHWLRRELRYGSFERRLTLPKGIDASLIAAQFENGMLHVSVPKPEKEQPRKIDVEVSH